MTRDELIELWCQALESGEYVQGKAYLKRKKNDDTEYCCFGVLCEVVKRAIPDFTLKETHGPYSNEIVYIEGEHGVLPKKVADIVGLRTRWGDFESAFSVNRGKLTELNDYSHTFKEIAALIRSRPKGLFVEES